MSPEFVVPLAPTPEPLAMLHGLVLAPLGYEAATGLRVLAFVTVGGLAVVALSCARDRRPDGGRRRRRLRSGTRGYLDVLFVALALGAARALARDAPARHVAGRLAAGGLVRPEAWLLSAVHVGWAWRLDRRVPRELVANRGGSRRHLDPVRPRGDRRSAVVPHRYPGQRRGARARHRSRSTVDDRAATRRGDRPGTGPRRERARDPRPGAAPRSPDRGACRTRPPESRVVRRPCAGGVSRHRVGTCCCRRSC